jgi:hypothetical protein
MYKNLRYNDHKLQKTWYNDQKVQKFVEIKNENFRSDKFLYFLVLYILALYQSEICTTRSLYEEHFVLRGLLAVVLKGTVPSFSIDDLSPLP